MGRIAHWAGWLLLSAAPAVSAAPPPPAPVVAYDEDDPAYRRLAALSKIADDLDDLPAAERDPAKVEAALQAVVDLGRRTPVRGSRLTHPTVGHALSSMAANAQAAGDNARGMALAEEALAILRPFREFYPNGYIQSISLLGYLRGAAGQPAAAAESLSEGVAFAEARLVAKHAEVTATDYMAASNIEYSYSDILQKLGQNDRAVELQRRSLQSRVTAFGADDPNAIASRYGLAIALLRAGKNAEAEATARDAVERAVAHVPTTHTSYARSLEALGLVLSRSGKRTEAIEYLRRSLDIKRQNGGAANRNYMGGLQNLGNILIQLERYPEAAAVLDETIAGFAAIEPAPGQEAIRAIGYRGLTAFAEGKPAEAARQLGDAYALARARDAKEREVGQLVLPVLILAKHDIGDVAAARSLAQAYAAEVGGVEGPTGFKTAYAAALSGYVGGSADPATAAAAHRIVDSVADNRSLSATGELPQIERAALDLALRIAVARRDPALALDAMTVLAGSRIAQANRLLAQRLVDADPALAAQVRAYQDVTRAYQAADSAVLKALATGEGLATARQARDAAGQAQAAARAALSRDFPRWVEASASDRAGLPAVQAGLQPGEVLLGTIAGFDGVYVLTIGPKAATVERAALGRSAVVELVRRVRDSLPIGQYDVTAAQQLHAQFFTADNAAILKSASALRIVPTGALATLPFAALVERPVKRADRATPWLIRRYALRVSPGFGALPAPVRSTDATAVRFLGVGAPTPFPLPAGQAARPATLLAADRYFRGGAVDTAALSSLPTLPGTEREVRAVASRLGPQGATILTGAAASESGLRAMDLTPFAVMLFATHGLLSGEMEGVVEPALVLAPPAAGSGLDGLLSTSEIAMLRLNADWVILSACNTAAGDGAGAPAFSGVAQAFRYAGARSLLLSHWPVRDDAASAISIATVAGARRGLPRAVALQRAMLALIADRSVAGGDDPYVWAPYVLVD